WRHWARLHDSPFAPLRVVRASSPGLLLRFMTGSFSRQRLASCAHGLADAQQIAFAIAKPHCTFASPALTRIVTNHVRDSVRVLRTREVVRLEHNAPHAELSYRGFDIVHIPCHLRVRARRNAAGFEQREFACGTAVEQPAGSLLAWLQPELF